MHIITNIIYAIGKCKCKIVEKLIGLLKAGLTAHQGKISNGE